MQDIIQLPVFSDRARLVFNNQALRLRKIYVIFIAILLTIPGGIASSLRRGRIDNCEQIRIPVCQGMPYNMTRMPNLMHHSTQENARLAIGVYDGLLRQNCSEDLLFFLCSMFAPICTPHFQKEAIPPCRAVCERAKKGCEPVMNRYNFSWPTTLDCDSLPEYDKGVCVEPDAIVSSMPEGWYNIIYLWMTLHVMYDVCKFAPNQSQAPHDVFENTTDAHSHFFFVLAIVKLI